MPSAIIHRCVHKKIMNKIQKYKNEDDIYLYDISSVAPDSWRNTKEFKNSDLPKKLKRKKSHFSKETEFVENYKEFLNKYKENIDNPFIFGYLIHLMTDNFWRIEMYYKRYHDIANIDNNLLNIEKSEDKNTLNEDIERLTGEIKKYYNIQKLTLLDNETINKLPIVEELPYDGINTTIEFTNTQLIVNENKKPKEYSFNDMINGIDIVTNKIIEELKKEKLI